MPSRRDCNRKSLLHREDSASPSLSAATTASPLRYYGGLQFHARKIVEMLPPHDSYVEPFAGGMSVLLSKPQSDTECVSDLHPGLIDFWRVVQRKRPTEPLLTRLVSWRAC